MTRFAGDLLTENVENIHLVFDVCLTERSCGRGWRCLLFPSLFEQQAFLCARKPTYSARARCDHLASCAAKRFAAQCCVAEHAVPRDPSAHVWLDDGVKSTYSGPLTRSLTRSEWSTVTGAVFLVPAIKPKPVIPCLVWRGRSTRTVNMCTNIACCSGCSRLLRKRQHGPCH